MAGIVYLDGEATNWFESEGNYILDSYLDGEATKELEPFGKITIAENIYGEATQLTEAEGSYIFGYIFNGGTSESVSEAEGSYDTAQIFSIGTIGPPASNAAEYALASGNFIIGSVVRTYRHISLDGLANVEVDAFGDMLAGHSEYLEGIDALHERWSEGILSFSVDFLGEAIQEHEAIGEFKFLVTLQGNDVVEVTEAEGDYDVQSALAGVAVQLMYGDGVVAEANFLHGKSFQVSFGEHPILRETNFLDGSKPEQLSKGCGDVITRGESFFYKDEHLSGEVTQVSYGIYTDECEHLHGASLKSTVSMKGVSKQISFGENIRDGLNSNIEIISYLSGTSIQYTDADCYKILLNQHLHGSKTEWTSEAIGRIPLIKVLLFQEREKTISSKQLGIDYDILVNRSGFKLAVTPGISWGSSASHPDIEVQVALFGEVTHYTEAQGTMIVEDYLFGEATQYNDAEGSFRTIKNLEGETFQYSNGAGVLSEEQYMYGESSQAYEGIPSHIKEQTALFGIATSISEGINSFFKTESRMDGSAVLGVGGDTATLRTIYQGLKGSPVEQYKEAINILFSTQVYVEGSGENNYVSYGEFLIGKALFSSTEQVFEPESAHIQETNPLYGVTEQVFSSEGHCETYKDVSGIADQVYQVDSAIMTLIKHLTGADPISETDGSGIALAEKLAGGKGLQVSESGGFLSTSTFIEPITDPSIELYYL